MHEIPTTGKEITTAQLIYVVQNLRAIVAMTDEVTDVDVRSIPIGSRQCRFPEENSGIWVSEHYSYTACWWQCVVEMSMSLCNCSNVIVGQNTGNLCRSYSVSNIENAQEAEDYREKSIRIHFLTKKSYR